MLPAALGLFAWKKSHPNAVPAVNSTTHLPSPPSMPSANGQI